jgi:GxxExxY protein
MPERDPLTSQIIGAAIDVHKALGPGLLESVYELCLCHELKLRGVIFERQVPVPIRYRGEALDGKLFIDIIVNKEVVVELKAVQEWHPVYEAQLLTYLKLTGLRTGLLLNFNCPVLRNGIKRMVL